MASICNITSTSVDNQHILQHIHKVVKDEVKGTKLTSTVVERGLVYCDCKRA